LTHQKRCAFRLSISESANGYVIVDRYGAVTAPWRWKTFEAWAIDDAFVTIDDRRVLAQGCQEFRV